MNTNKTLIAIIVCFLITVAGCSTVAVTNRRQLNLIPTSNMLSMSLQQYDQFIETNKLSDDPEKTAMVKRVGGRIQKAVEDYYIENGDRDELDNYSWEFNLIEDDTVNAWCMPGGKVVVYTGILKVAADETELAVVVGHEIAHAVAKHGNERMSQGLIAQMGGVALSTALSRKPEATRQLWMTAYGLGAQYGAILPYSRLQEKEADHLGLIFMAKAGYNPKSAVSFWTRMSEMKGGQAPPEYLSTHPSDSTRIKSIEKLLPDVMKYYNP